MPNYREYVKSLSLQEALWWFIENDGNNVRTNIFFDLRERYRARQVSPVDDLIKATKSLVSDIEAMQSGTDEDWFGDFNENQETNEYGAVAVEWPNLRISLDRVTAELAKLPAEPGIIGNKATLLIVDEIGPSHDLFCSDPKHCVCRTHETMARCSRSTPDAGITEDLTRGFPYG